MYFTLLDFEIVALPVAGDRLVLLRYFSIATGSLVTVAFFATYAFPRSLWGALAEVEQTQSEQDFHSIAGRLMNIPVVMSGFAVAVWLGAGVTLAIYGGAWLHSWDSGIRTFIGVGLVGAPLTLLFLYFVLETILRECIVQVAPLDSLLSRPPCFRIGVLPRLIFVILTVSIPPITALSYFSLGQIEKMKVGQISMSQFVSDMPSVIIFFSVVGLTEAIGLSVLIARSISIPLRDAGAAMDRVGLGNLDSAVPVLSRDELGVAAEGLNRMG